MRRRNSRPESPEVQVPNQPASSPLPFYLCGLIHRECWMIDQGPLENLSLDEENTSTSRAKKEVVEK